MLRGITHRAGRSTVVASLAAVAVAAAVLAPGFSRAAQQSVLTDGLARAGAAGTDVTVTATGTAGAAPVAHEVTGDARLVIDTAIGRHPALADVVGDPVGGVDTDTQVQGADEPLAARLAYRDRVCEHLVITGQCPIDAGQVLVSDRTAQDYGITPGDRLTVRFAERDREFEVAGTYRPRDPGARYWGRTVYFTHGGFDPATGVPRVDALLTVAESDVQADPDAVVALSLTYPLRAGAVRLDDVPALRAGLASLRNQAQVVGLEPQTALPSILDEAADDQAAVGRIVPIVAAPLVLLAWFVLFLLVAALIEERGREIALAKLRGFPAGRAARFGLGEGLFLIVVGAVPGFALGLGLVEVASRIALADGTHVELRSPVVIAAAAALAAAAAAAVLAGLATLRQSALALLRRVPERAGWRAGVTDGVVVALAGASLLAALGDRTAPLAMLAPALLAVLAGIAAARLVRLWSALRLRVARRRGRIPGMLSAAQLSRRPAGRRVVVVVTVAVALLTFAATAWDVATQARRDHAVDIVGADRVYQVAADHPTALLEAVRTADPDGTSMAVVRASRQYGGQSVALLAVDAPRLDGVARWRGPETGALAGALRPQVPEQLRVADRMEVSARVAEPGPEDVRLSAVVSVPGEPPGTVTLGTLREGAGSYRADLPQCAGSGCRLLGLRLGRTGAAGPFTVTVAVDKIRSGGEEVAAGFDQQGAWAADTEGQVTVTPGTALTVEVAGGPGSDVLVAYRDIAEALPVVLAGPAPADDPAASAFDFPGFAERSEPFAVVATATRLPRAAQQGLLFDLEYAVASAERSVALSDSVFTYEVWAHGSAPADLPQRLVAAGIPVLGTETLAGTVDQLGRRAPALGLWMYLLAAGVAVALALGVVALSGRVGVESRRYELAALRVTGVRARLLRRALLREQAALVGWPLVIGAVTGVAAAAVMLPGIPLVQVGVLTTAVAYRPEMGALPVAVAATLAGLALAALRAVRLLRQATPDRLREGWQ
jgi:hypothetical protein